MADPGIGECVVDYFHMHISWLSFLNRANIPIDSYTACLRDIEIVEQSQFSNHKCEFWNLLHL